MWIEKKKKTKINISGRRNGKTEENERINVTEGPLSHVGIP